MDEDKQACLTVLAVIFHAARLASPSDGEPSEAFDEAEAFMAEAEKRGINILTIRK